MNELKRFDNDLKNSEELRKKLDETATRIRNEGQAESDGDLIVRAAKELGYDFSIADLEKRKAEAEPLDPAEFEEVAGGKAVIPFDICWSLWTQNHVDEYDHNALCTVTWHCYMAMLHTETNEKDMSCLADYSCVWINH